eukprot:TRINITY_DN49316_c0_g1_i2.p1 TRINITY_DN49316_c0_g1~~TRINITY_DN49316_c0_g1_i2.p1  ORF type:complete len:1033 (-),score=132.46 TRINITY_DN49316_c0_g1_i2:74-3172(-)
MSSSGSSRGHSATAAPGETKNLLYTARGTEDLSDSEDSEMSPTDSDVASEPSEKTHNSCCLGFEQVLSQEKFDIDKRRFVREAREDSRRPGQAGRRERFDLAFSGGGVRAASFQAGVLWKLAEQKRLSDVDYLVAVSGGAYIASAFASHVLEAGEPAPGESTDRWYRQIVARTLARMQENIGYLVRDVSSNPWQCPKDGSSRLPRAFDYPIMLGVLLFTISINPITFVVMFLVPLTMLIDRHFGEVMRVSFCLPAGSMWQVFVEWGRFPVAAYGLLFFVLLTFLIYAMVWVIRLPCLRPNPTGKNADNIGWLIAHGTQAFLVRASGFFFLVIFLIVCATVFQYSDYANSPDRDIVCMEYRAMLSNHCLGVGADSVLEFWNSTLKNMTVEEYGKWLRYDGPIVDTRADVNLLNLVVRWLLGALAISFVLSPFFDKLFFKVLGLVGPIMLLVFSECYVIWRVFSPLTSQALAGPPLFDIQEHLWARSMPEKFEAWALGVAFVMVPCYHRLHNTMHQFYTKSLRRAFFSSGQEHRWHELGENLFCPFLLLTGTVNDYVQPGLSQSIHEISFSHLHTGSETTSFIPTEPHMSLSKATALAGAATDAFILGMLERIQYRFWLEVLNLCMGDFIPFNTRPSRAVSCLRGCMHRFFTRCIPKQKETHVILRSVSSMLLMVVYGLLIASAIMTRQVWHHPVADDGRPHSMVTEPCEETMWLTTSAMIIVSLMFALSFYGFASGLEILLHCPGIRFIHQATRFYHQAEVPPRLVYVTDGGLQDCCGLMQLCQRKSKRILLVLAADDPDDKLEVLRTSMRMVRKAKYASFYDPKDPRRDIQILIDEFQADSSILTLHLGIRYGWSDKLSKEDSETPTGAPEAAATPDRHGHLVVVKYRVPPHLLHEPMRPLISEKLVMGESDTDGDDDSLDGPPQTELGGCCCDCCHVRGCNFGKTFPNIPTMNQCFTPQLFNCMCRLGYNISSEAISLVTNPDLKSTWEDAIDTPAPAAANGRSPPRPDFNAGYARPVDARSPGVMTMAPV